MVTTSYMYLFFRFFQDFINKELILFSNMDNERSIPSLVDGFKPGQRKIIFTCIKRNFDKKEIKVAQLSGSVAELSAYHHGEVKIHNRFHNTQSKKIPLGLFPAKNLCFIRHFWIIKTPEKMRVHSSKLILRA